MRLRSKLSVVQMRGKWAIQKSYNLRSLSLPQRYSGSTDDALQIKSDLNLLRQLLPTIRSNPDLTCPGDHHTLSLTITCMWAA